MSKTERETLIAGAAQAIIDKRVTYAALKAAGMADADVQLVKQRVRQLKDAGDDTEAETLRDVLAKALGGATPAPEAPSIEEYETRAGRRLIRVRVPGATLRGQDTVTMPAEHVAAIVGVLRPEAERLADSIMGNDGE